MTKLEKRYTVRLTREEASYLEAKYGSVYNAFRDYIKKEITGINGIDSTIKTPKSHIQRETYIFLYMQFRERNFTFTGTQAVRVIQKKFDIQKRAAKNRVETLRKSGFIRKEGMKLRLVKKRSGE